MSDSFAGCFSELLLERRCEAELEQRPDYCRNSASPRIQPPYPERLELAAFPALEPRSCQVIMDSMFALTLSAPLSSLSPRCPASPAAFGRQVQAEKSWLESPTSSKRDTSTEFYWYRCSTTPQPKTYVSFHAALKGGSLGLIPGL